MQKRSDKKESGNAAKTVLKEVLLALFSVAAGFLIFLIISLSL
jgi:hypothetical protein